MNERDEIEEQLRPAFDALRRADAQATPSFDELLARARAGAAAPAQPSVDEVARRAPRSPWRWVAYAAPLAAAAGLAIWLLPARAADREFEREFERAVSDWSRTERALPTDGLLAVPGSEYLRRLPVLRTEAGQQRGPS